MYQLEESELMAEPLPTRDNRQSILFYEAAEGGAGVLTRLATEPDALGRRGGRSTARSCTSSTASRPAWTKGSLVEELDQTGQPICEAGCYKCLLSYYNQPDHPLIDRKDKDADGLVLDILCRLTCGLRPTVPRAARRSSIAAELARTAGSSLEQAWLAYVERTRPSQAGPRAAHHRLGANTCADFFYDDYNLAVFIDGPHHDSEAQTAKDAEIDREPRRAGLPCRSLPQGHQRLARHLRHQRRPLRCRRNRIKT